MEDEDHLDPYGNEESEQILPFQRIGDLDLFPRKMERNEWYRTTNT